jgi:hypothetical protein
MCSVKQYVIKAHYGRKVQLHTFLALVLERSDCQLHALTTLQLAVLPLVRLGWAGSFP